MNIIDYIMITILILAALIGFRKGVLGSIVTFVGTLIVIIIAYYLKNPLSTLLYQWLPFFSLGGKFAGVSVFNILIYEGISYLLTMVILATILGVIIKVTGVVDKIINATVILSLPNRILGAVCGLLEGYILAFIIFFILNLAGGATIVNNSRYANYVLESTPVLSKVMQKTYHSISEVYQICTDAKDSKDEANLKSLDVLLKYEILSVASADKIIELGKIKTPGAGEVVDKYRGR